MANDSNHNLTVATNNRFERNLTAWTLLAGLLLFAALAGPFFAGRIYTADDLGAFHLPMRAFYAEQLAEGEPFDWMPTLYSGFYLTGEGQTGAYHPLHQLLYRTLSLRAAMAWECLLSYPLMMFGMWLFLRRRIGSGAAAAVGALMFTFCGFNLLHFVHPNAIAVIAHIPWLLWAIDIVLTDARRRRVTFAAALIALLTGSQLLLGYPQYVWLSLVAEGCYAAFLLTTDKYVVRRGCDMHYSCADCIGCSTQTWPRLIIALGIGVLLGGVQLMPTLDAWLHSSRAAADSSFAGSGSLHPLNLLQLIAPYLLSNRVVWDNTHEFGLYAGAAPLLLIVWLIARCNEIGSLRRMYWAAFAFAFVALLLAFGRYGPLQFATTWLPVIGSFRCPCRYLILFQLALAVLAAIGFLLLVRECRTARKNPILNCNHLGFVKWLWRDFEPIWCAVLVSIVAAAIGLWLSGSERIGSVFAILAGPGLFVAAAVLIVAAARGRAAALAALIVLIACDLGFYGLSYSVYPSNDSLGRLVASAETPPGEPDGRVLADLLRYDRPGLRTGNLMTMAGWQRADGYAGLSPVRRLDYARLPALRVAGVAWVKKTPSTENIEGLTAPNAEKGEAEKEGTEKGEVEKGEAEKGTDAGATAGLSSSASGIPRKNTAGQAGSGPLFQQAVNDRWSRVPNPLPRVRLVSQTRLSFDPAADIAAIPLETTALVETPLSLPPSTPGEAVVTRETPGRIEIDVHCPASQLLVVAESHHPGWRAEIDGRPAQVLRVNGDFIGCPVEAGRHAIVFEFRPESLQRGWMATITGICLLSLCLLGFTVRPKSRLSEGLDNER